MRNIINAHAAKGLMRAKTTSKLTETLPNYIVALIENEIVGTCGFKIWPGDGVEIISSAVKRKYHGIGIGQAMNQDIIAHCKEMGFGKFFVLTEQVGFYEKLGFTEIPKSKLHAKTFSDCADCPRNKSNVPGRVKCADVAMVLNSRP